MTDPNLTHVALVLDRSGSMAPIAAETVAGVRAFLAEQAKLPGRVRISLVLFNDVVRTVVWDKAIDGFALADDDYKPHGNTALYDAIGETVARLGNDLSLAPEDARPGNVTVCIVTDGYENSSRHYARERIADMVAHQQAKYAWRFTYLGANQDAVLMGQTIGISGDASLTYSTNKSEHVFLAASACLRSAQLSKSPVTYSADIRASAIDTEVKS